MLDRLQHFNPLLFWNVSKFWLSCWGAHFLCSPRKLNSSNLSATLGEGRGRVVYEISKFSWTLTPQIPIYAVGKNIEIRYFVGSSRACNRRRLRGRLAWLLFTCPAFSIGIRRTRFAFSTAISLYAVNFLRLQGSDSDDEREFTACCNSRGSGGRNE